MGHFFEEQALARWQWDRMHPSPEGTPRTVRRRGLGEVNCQLASETRLVGAPGLARKSRGWRLGLTGRLRRVKMQNLNLNLTPEEATRGSESE